MSGDGVDVGGANSFTHSRTLESGNGSTAEWECGHQTQCVRVSVIVCCVRRVRVCVCVCDAYHSVCCVSRVRV